MVSRAHLWHVVFSFSSTVSLGLSSPLAPFNLLTDCIRVGFDSGLSVWFLWFLNLFPGCFGNCSVTKGSANRGRETPPARPFPGSARQFGIAWSFTSPCKRRRVCSISVKNTMRFRNALHSLCTSVWVETVRGEGVTC